MTDQYVEGARPERDTVRESLHAMQAPSWEWREWQADDDGRRERLRLVRDYVRRRHHGLRIEMSHIACIKEHI